MTNYLNAIHALDVRCNEWGKTASVAGDGYLSAVVCAAVNLKYAAQAVLDCIPFSSAGADIREESVPVRAEPKQQDRCYPPAEEQVGAPWVELTRRGSTT